jgi:lysophospholipase L1-like esterase
MKLFIKYRLNLLVYSSNKSLCNSRHCEARSNLKQCFALDCFTRSLRQAKRNTSFAMTISCLFYLFSSTCHSQIKQEGIINHTKNKIVGDSLSLSHFFNGLDSLQAHSKKTLSIVHIGDSHIQADCFSGMLRMLFHQKFGNAGRGLIFPYKIAHTNEPVNYRSSSNSEWLSVRNVLNPNNYNIGVSGISIFSKTNHTDINIKVRNSTHCNYAFNSIELFSEHATTKNTDIKNCAEKNKFNSFLTSFALKDTTHSVTLNFSSQSTIDIHGLVLKNDSAGILYHTIGVNGATFKSYNKTSLFAQQLNYLHPDLVIISLGTNESYDAKFDSLQFKKELQEFVSTIKTACNYCSVLFTTPADNFKIHKKKAIHNAKPKLVSQLLINYANANHYATWNLYDIMGGKGSMKTWHNNKLATKDYVHFTRAGYELQGELIFEAILNRYNSTK